MSVTDLQLFTHLVANCGGLHKTNAVKIQASMRNFYNAAEGITKYINMLEEVQAQSERSALPIRYDALVNISNSAMLALKN